MEINCCDWYFEQTVILDQLRKITLYLPVLISSSVGFTYLCRFPGPVVVWLIHMPLF